MVQKKEPNYDRVGESPVEGNRLEQHVTPSIRQVLLQVSSPFVPEADRLHGDRKQQSRLLRGPGHIDLLGADSSRHPPFSAGWVRLPSWPIRRRGGGTCFGKSALPELAGQTESELLGEDLGVALLLGLSGGVGGLWRESAEDLSEKVGCAHAVPSPRRALRSKSSPRARRRLRISFAANRRLPARRIRSTCSTTFISSPFRNVDPICARRLRSVGATCRKASGDGIGSLSASLGSSLRMPPP